MAARRLEFLHIPGSIERIQAWLEDHLRATGRFLAADAVALAAGVVAALGLADPDSEILARFTLDFDCSEELIELRLQPADEASGEHLLLLYRPSNLG